MKKLGKHGGRLIIRNLPFSIDEKYLRAILEKIGTLAELTFPIDQSKNRNKGFAFFEYDKKNLSEKAIKSLNGSKIQKREISVDYAMSKDKYLATLKSEEISKDFKPQPIEEVKEEIIEEDYQEEVTEKKVKKMNFDEGKVIFLMNLNFETQEEDLFEFFKDFGRIKYTKIVVNPETGESKGSGFVCFVKSEDADKVIKLSEEQGIELQERRLKIMRAVSRESAVNLKSAKPETTDKRNLHLTKLCLLPIDSDAFKSLTPKEVEMRTLAAKKMKEKLLNPNIFVSPTRVLFKNIPKVLSDNDLKVLVKKILCENDPELEKKKLFNQVKVLKETDRYDKKGNLLSKGIAFIEFKKDEYALLAVRLCNCNSKYFGEKNKPIVEFALEDHRILRIRKLKLSRQKKKAIDKLGENKTAKMGRGKRQRLKRKELREANHIKSLKT